jgi:cytoskeletal protein CcmA (bactofilin family)
MARPDSPGMINGFMSVQAVRRKNDHGPDQKPPEAPSPPKETRHPSAPPPQASRIGHTALPSRHELICYSCEYSFTVTGRLDKVFCPKCREQLETGDHIIEGEWRDDVRTVGQVHVKPGATVHGATIVATDIIIGGNCDNAILNPTRRIELETGASVTPRVLDMHTILIRKGERLSFTAPLRCQDLELHGELQAQAMPRGTVTVHPGGMFRGTLKTSHLIVHDGGGLSAMLEITPEPPKPKATPPATQTKSAAAPTRPLADKATPAATSQPKKKTASSHRTKTATKARKKTKRSKRPQ